MLLIAIICQRREGRMTCEDVFMTTLASIFWFIFIPMIISSHIHDNWHRDYLKSYEEIRELRIKRKGFDK